MLVHFVTDASNKMPAIRAMLEPQHVVQPRLLGAAAEQALSNGVLVVDADLRKAASVEQLKAVMRDLRRVSHKLFVVQAHLRDMVSQAFALGATAVISRPRDIASKLAQVELGQKSKADSANTQPEIAASAECLSSIFSAIKSGQKIALSDAEQATREVVNGIKHNGLTSWLDDVRRYHQGTFQHCLLVTGVAVAFGLDIKLPDADVFQLGLAATLHDVGKARIPLTVLDKPGRLDQDELAIMNLHPVIGYELLKSDPQIGPEILGAVRHHHEYLDGSGYPDGLVGPAISDIVRLLTISDIFAALIESRPYKRTMSRQDAYNILCGMDGKLEGQLVKAFRRVALTG